VSPAASPTALDHEVASIGTGLRGLGMGATPGTPTKDALAR
jgi:hypothetical protein